MGQAAALSVGIIAVAITILVSIYFYDPQFHGINLFLAADLMECRGASSLRALLPQGWVMGWCLDTVYSA